ncbi:MAG: OmpA family protein [Bacteroidales bacterium]|nr:OmpA family protein [Bacteroidales bacterium]
MKKNIRHISPKITQTVATYYEPQVVNPYEAVITDTKNWTRISGIFTAEGGEKFLTIGNFYPTSKSNLTDIDSLSYMLPGAYFYIDSVSLYRINYDTSTNTGEALTIIADTSAEIITSTPLEKGSTVILENIFFEFDKSTLLQQSYHELKKLTDILLQYPKMKIEIGGHTDSRGSAAYNQRLSESRARAVVEYLSSKGIDSSRLKFKGYGTSKPIDTNSTEEGRARNRRVEFTVLDM